MLKTQAKKADRRAHLLARLLTASIWASMSRWRCCIDCTASACRACTAARSAWHADAQPTASCNHLKGVMCATLFICSANGSLYCPAPSFAHSLAHVHMHTRFVMHFHTLIDTHGHPPTHMRTHPTGHSLTCSLAPFLTFHMKEGRGHPSLQHSLCLLTLVHTACIVTDRDPPEPASRAGSAC